MPSLQSLQLEPRMISAVINLVLDGWIIAVILKQFLNRINKVEDLLIAILPVLVGLRFGLFGMLEVSPMKVILAIGLFLAGLKLLKANVKWQVGG